MDFYCKVKLADGSSLMIEEVFQKAESLEWNHANASGIKDSLAVFPAFGANDREYELLVNLKNPAQKALIRKEDGVVFFSGILEIR